MKILNLYAGIGGNRTLWREEHEVTAVENNKERAEVYQKRFPNDTVVVGDAHKYLLEHHSEFDFIWSSPPCPTHSRLNYPAFAKGNVRFPDMKLYEEIIFLQWCFKGQWCVENVISYYDPLIKPKLLGRHYYWSNFKITEIPKIDNNGRGMGKTENIEDMQKLKGFDLSGYKISADYPKLKVLRNCVEPKAGLHIFNCAFKIKQEGLMAFNKPNTHLEEK